MNTRAWADMMRRSAMVAALLGLALATTTEAKTPPLTMTRAKRITRSEVYNYASVDPYFPKYIGYGVPDCTRLSPRRVRCTADWSWQRRRDDPESPPRSRNCWVRVDVRLPSGAKKPTWTTKNLGCHDLTWLPDRS